MQDCNWNFQLDDESMKKRINIICDYNCDKLIWNPQQFWKQPETPLGYLDIINDLYIHNLLNRWCKFIFSSIHSPKYLLNRWMQISFHPYIAWNTGIFRDFSIHT